PVAKALKTPIGSESTAPLGPRRVSSSTRLSARPTDTQNRIVFGMVPQRDDDKTRLLLNDLCAYLAKQVDMVVVPHRSPSTEALASALHAGRVHVAWVGALQMLLSEHMTEMTPILSAVREGVAFYHSVLFSPGSSSITDLAGAKGKRIAWVAQASAAGYVVPRLSLARRGIVADGYFSEEIFAGSHAKATQAVVDGDADVAATYAIFEDGDPAKPLVKSGYRTMDPKLEVHVLDTSGPIPSDLIVAAPSVSAKVTRAVSQALLRIATDRASKEIMTDLIGADDFTPFTAAVLREVRALVDVARASGALIE
ncbi:MAG: phosphate/phosphite/phosphonate ABC transporter substrate-binding protein, partial [Polyangiales bacterium]